MNLLTNTKNSTEMLMLTTTFTRLRLNFTMISTQDNTIRKATVLHAFNCITSQVHNLHQAIQTIIDTSAAKVRFRPCSMCH